MTFDTYEVGKTTLDEYLDRVFFYEDRLMFVQVAETLGLKGIHHKNYESIKGIFASYGLVLL